MRPRCLDCGLLVSKAGVVRCRACNGHQMRVRHRINRALRAGVLSVNAKAARRLVKRIFIEKETVYGA